LAHRASPAGATAPASAAQAYKPRLNQPTFELNESTNSLTFSLVFISCFFLLRQSRNRNGPSKAI
jgi:hypothetical protein